VGGAKKRGLNRKPGPPVHDDLVERDFTAAAPNELWLTDITEHPTEAAEHLGHDPARRVRAELLSSIEASSDDEATDTKTA
jgi:transposase InsO family protein